MTELALIVLGGLKFGAIYALAALGLVVIHKATRTVNFAHGSFVLLGAFGAFYIQVDQGLPAWAAYLLVPVAVGIFSAAGIPKDIELPIYMDTPSLDAQVGVLTAKTPAIVLSGPGVFRVRREALAASVSVGVFSDT